MKKIVGLSSAAALLLAVPAASYAQSTGAGTNSNPNSARQYAPGQQDRSKLTRPGVSSVSPGHKMQTDTTGSVTEPGASGYAPGHEKKLPLNKTNSSSHRK